MTANRRIFLNIVATYGRSLYAMVLGLFTARWVLRALGQIDYGLLGLVGGLTMFVAFLNALLASAVGRFYAVEVGAARNVEKGLGLENCRKWFNVALSLHSLIPVILLIIGYPIGNFAILHWLAIPVDRIEACVWVWRYTCLSCFFAMLCVPFQAMYTAKQEIAELTIYSVLTTTLNAGFMYYMVQNPGVWLVEYSAWTFATASLPQFIIAIRAVMKYPECRFNAQYLWDRSRYAQLFKYAFARFWTSFSGVFGSQGQSILVNKYMGAIYNASMTVGNGVAGHAISFSNALSGAFWPAIANKAGEKNGFEMEHLCFCSCRYGAVLVLIFAVPLSLEIDEILKLWLVTPPDFSAQICLVVLGRMVFEKMTEGYELAICATGNGVVRFSWIAGWAGICTVLVAWLCFALGLGMWSIVIGLSFSKVMTCAVRLYMGRYLVGFSSRYWLKRVFIPIMVMSGIALLVGGFMRALFKPSFLRVVLTTALCEMVIGVFTWRVVLDSIERDALMLKMRQMRKGLK